MCRIAAIVSHDKKASQLNILKMTDAMHRGGPDSSGYFCDENLPITLGHRRLSIIDLSSAGYQPMQDISNNYIISYNGEIYNYIPLKNELEKKGYVFKSNSDTEVLLNGYSEWGSNLFGKLNGMFAFILIDKRKKELIAVRDSEGIKPLYFGKEGGKFYFSSEIRGFQAINPNWSEYSQWSIFFLTFGFIPEPYTTLQNVSHLPKGSYMVYNLENYKYEIFKYSQVNFSLGITDLNEAIQLTRSTVISAIESHLIGDVPVGVFLSGGLDSSIITSVAQQKHKEKLNSLSIYFEDDKYSEKNFQNLVISRTGVIHKSFKVSNEEYQKALPDILQAMDQPSIDGVNTYFISKYAKEAGFKVVLSGLGADEYFGGYSSFDGTLNRVKRLKNAIKIIGFLNGNYSFKKVSFLDEKRWYNDYLLNRGLFSPKDTANITGFSVSEVNSVLNLINEPSEFEKLNSNNKISYLESNLYMQSQLLRDSDIFSMWHSLELRVPFLDRNVVNLAKSIDPAIKFNKKQKKHLLIEAFKDDLPQEVWNRKKQGFAFPFETWYSKNKFLTNSNYLPQKWQKLFLQQKINYSRIWAIFLQRTFNQNR
jgi:asparagine synthase (glutamine-hydrolysing)